MDQDKMMKCAREFVLTERSVLVEDGPPQPRITISWRGEDTWAILIDMLCYNRNGQTEYEPMPSSRDEDFLQRARFTLEEAWELTEKLIEENNFRTVY